MDFLSAANEPGEPAMDDRVISMMMMMMMMMS
jgi:hypothetical protein